MKTIGLLGGTSWPSTIAYYSYLNRHIAKQLGSYHSAKILLYSIDYNDIKSNYTAAWDQVVLNLKKELQYLASKQPDVILICNNTLHKALDEIVDLDIQIPILHIGHCAIQKAQDRGMKQLLFLGTKVTMENGYYKQLYENNGLSITIPNETERNEIQAIQSGLAAGETDPSFSQYFESLVDTTYGHLDGVILGCTELPLAFEEYKHTERIIDTIQAQCDAAIQFALES